MERGMSVDQLFRALWRRRVLAGVILLGGFAVGAVVVMALPEVYEATSVVRVEPQRPGEEMVQRTVSDLLEQRMLTVRQELLSRPILQQVIEEQKLYPKLREKGGMEAAIARMREDLSVRVEGEHAFELSYRSHDPEVAAKVANRLPALYAAEAVRIRREQAARAESLFGSEVEQLKGRLSEWEQAIARFKVEHMGELPEQLESNMRGLERVAALRQTKSEELRIAEARRSDLARSRLAADSEAGRLKAAEDGLTQRLIGAQTSWTSDHPEVARLDTELKATRTRRQQAEAGQTAERLERARAAQLVESIQRDIQALELQERAYQERLDRTPQWAHALGVLQRDYEITRTKYQSVVSRQVEAQIAQQLELRSSEDMFRTVSPAGVPAGPIRPDRPAGLLLSLLLALALAVLVVVVLELRDESIRDPDELRGQLPLPVLAVVPQLGASRVERRVLTPDRSGRNELSGTPEGPLH